MLFEPVVTQHSELHVHPSIVSPQVPESWPKTYLPPIGSTLGPIISGAISALIAYKLAKRSFGQSIELQKSQNALALQQQSRKSKRDLRERHVFQIAEKYAEAISFAFEVLNARQREAIAVLSEDKNNRKAEFEKSVALITTLNRMRFFLVGIDANQQRRNWLNDLVEIIKQYDDLPNLPSTVQKYNSITSQMMGIGRSIMNSVQEERVALDNDHVEDGTKPEAF